MDPACNLCKRENESTLHGLGICLEVRKVWYASPLSLRINQDKIKIISFQDWVKKGLTMNNTRNKDKTWLCEYIVIIYWPQIWINKNKTIFENVKFDMKLIVESTCRLKNEIEEIMPRKEQMENKEDEHWDPSQPNMIKINFMELFQQPIKMQEWV